MKFKVVNTIHLPGMDFGEKLLEPIDAELIKASGKTEGEIIENAKDADAVICSGPVQPWSARVINSLNKCRIIASLGVGYDRIDLERATDMGIVVTNIPAYCIDEVSSHAIALILSLGRKLFLIDRTLRDMNINFVPPNRKSVNEVIYPVFRLREQTLGIFGLGKIGAAAALKARGLGMKVIAYDPYVLDEVIQSKGVIPVDFETLLKESDFISLHSSLNEETKSKFNEESFKMMKPTSYLVNTARGEIVDQKALAGALTNKEIAGAGLDVTEKDPVPVDDPILDAPNTILTGHSAWYSTAADSEEKFWHKAMEQVVSALNNIWPVYAINLEVHKKWQKKWGKKT